ncbi:DinB family protein [Marivirga sp.]|uniref:DinB family protein n=1 Tax=Marivirga sp. TaxID=2018662 RepID=UPI002D7EFF84|nr:DinB family protein [Marivirga sp.]HET8861324.1 DinB family protein [Marivirga sp.]
MKDIIKELKKVEETILNSFQNLSEEELLWKSGPSEWSIADCLKHIIIANTQYNEDIKKRLEKAEVKTIEYPIRFSLTGKLFLLAVDPKYKWKVPAPKIFKPINENRVSNGKQTVQEFLNLQEELIKTAQKACSYNHSNVNTYSPISKLLRFNVGEQLYIMMRHTKRHINQASNVKDKLKINAA